MMFLLRYIALISLLVVAYASDRNDPPISQCQLYFAYDQIESDRWFCDLRLLNISSFYFENVSLHLKFDRHILQIGSYYGEITRLPSDEYEISIPTFRAMRFIVRYDPNSGAPPPQLVGVKLRGHSNNILHDVTICPEDEDSILQSRASEGSMRVPVLVFNKEKSNFPTATFNAQSDAQSSQYDDDNFIGDFDIRRHPELGPGEEFKCGTVTTIRPFKYIKTYGHLTYSGEFPWHAALYIDQSEQKGLHYICGATLITAEHVITAAHCVMKRNSNTLIDWMKLRVYLGKYHLKQWDGDDVVQERNVSIIHVHHNYSPSDFSNDISIIRLQKPVVITDFVRTVCMWDLDTSGDPLFSSEPFFSGIVAGWGFDEGGRQLDELMQAKMSIPSSCSNELMHVFSKVPWRGTYCAGFPNGTALCNADSGSGMVFERWDETKTKRIFQLRGVVSVSVALQKNVTCSEKHYTTFTDLAWHSNWIKDHL